MRLKARFNKAFEGKSYNVDDIWEWVEKNIPHERIVMPKIAEDWTEKELFAKQLWDKLLNWIKDDIEFGYSSSMIYNKIITNCYDITHTKPMKHLQKNDSNFTV